MMTRSGERGWPRLILNSCSSAGTPSRTLSRSRLVWPSKTASARARWRNKCSLSSRDVKSTGPKFFVVTFPSAVIANVAMTNGRFVDAAPSPRSGTAERDEGVASTLLGFAEFMFQRDNFLFHFAEFHVFCCATRLVKQINKSARKTANENDRKTQRSDENGFCFGNATQPVKHDLQNFFTESDSRETDGQSRDRSFNRHDGKKINQRHSHTKRIRGKQESCKRCKMCHDRHAKRNERCPPMTCIQMIGCEDLNQFVASRKMSRKIME